MTRAQTNKGLDIVSSLDMSKYPVRGSCCQQPRNKLPLRSLLLTTLLSTVAANALLFATPQLAKAGPDGCTVSGTTITCSGDQSDGIANGVDPNFAAPPIDTLIVNELTGAITPAPGTDGISFSIVADGDININADTGPHGIATNGDSTDGIYSRIGGNGNITVTSTGNITTTGNQSNGLLGNIIGDGDLSITHSGDINTSGTNANGIIGDVTGVNDENNVMINNTGNISTTGNNADGIISRITGNGNVSINNTGNITTTGNAAEGIIVRINQDGNISINNTGNITTTGRASEGIFGRISRNGIINITNYGAITATGDDAEGIEGLINEYGTISIINNSSVATVGDNVKAIEAHIVGNNAYVSTISIINNGDVFADGDDGEGVEGRIDNTGNVSIINNGTIRTIGANTKGIDGVVATGNVTITSTGMINTTGNSAHGIYGYVSVDGDVGISNSGTVSTTEDFSYGIIGTVRNDGDITITNSGTISTTGRFSYGIYGNAGNDGDITLTNSGNISTTGRAAIGIYGYVTNDGNLTISNSGTISTTGNVANGITGKVDNDGDIIITNSGTISTTQNNAVGIYSLIGNIGNVTITTSGNVTSTQVDGISSNISGTGTHRITVLSSSTVNGNDEGIELIGGSSSHVTNFGTIIGADNAFEADILTSFTNAGKITGANHAILETGADDTVLTLLPGSDIFGAIDLGGGINTLNVGKGHSIDHNFASLPEVINTNGQPFVIDGTRVVVVDTSMLAQQDEVLFDITQSIWSTVFQNIGDGRNPGGSVMNGLASNNLGGPQYSLGATASIEDVPQNTKSHMWASLIGNHRIQNNTPPETSARHDLYGFIGGVDGRLNSQVRLGGFLGFSETEIDTPATQQETDVESYFGGLYASLKTDGLTFDLGITGGATKHDSTRKVDNNQVNGLETVSSSFDGTFVAPELSLSSQTPFAGMTLQPTLRAGYAGLFLDGFTETGALAPFTVAEQDIHILHARFEMALLMTSQGPDSLGFLFSPYVGVDGRSLLGGEAINATLLGQNLSFTPNGSDDVASVFAGMRFSVAKSESFGFFAGFEGSLDTEESSTITGNFGVKWRF